MRADVLSPTRDIRDALDDYEMSIQPELRKMYEKYIKIYVTNLSLKKSSFFLKK
jgi:hypothetical protein